MALTARNTQATGNCHFKHGENGSSTVMSRLQLSRVAAAERRRGAEMALERQCISLLQHNSLLVGLLKEISGPTFYNNF